MTIKRKLKSAVRLVTEADTRALWLAEKGYYNRVPDKEYLETVFPARTGYKLELDNPKTFNEKLQWLKLYDRNPLYTTLVDKAAVKSFVAQTIGEQYIIPTFGVWDRPEDIDLDTLPERFVLKCTHDSGGLSICREKVAWDRAAAEEKLNRALKRDFYMLGREWPYKNVKRRILAEQYMEDSRLKELRDYKFFCFNGKVRCFKIDWDRYVFHRANYYDPHGNVLTIGEVSCPPDPSRQIELPACLELMKTLAEELAEGIPFIRADFYEVDGSVFFGELTLYPAAGFGRFLSYEDDLMMGSWLALPVK